jgi:hypothetical protein
MRCIVVAFASMPLPLRETTSSLSQAMSFILPGVLATTLPTTALPSLSSQVGPAKWRPTILPSAISVASGSRKAQASLPSVPALHS